MLLKRTHAGDVAAHLEFPECRRGKGGAKPRHPESALPVSNSGGTVRQSR